MDWIGELHPTSVLAFSDLAREVGLLLSVVVAEGLDHAVSHPGVLGRHRLEESTADDLEALVVLGRLPLSRLSTHDVAQSSEGLLALVASDLDVACGNRDQDHNVFDRCCSLGERLGEGELGVEVPTDEARLVVA